MAGGSFSSSKPKDRVSLFCVSYLCVLFVTILSYVFVNCSLIEKVTSLVDSMKREVISGHVVGSYVHKINGIDIMFTHSGLRPEYLQYVVKQMNQQSLNSKIIDNSSRFLSASNISNYINTVVVAAVNDCHSYRCALVEETFEAGADRGGSRKYIVCCIPQSMY